MTNPQVHSPLTSASSLDVGRIRKDFPILEQSVHGKPLAYLDNAATTQKPLVVLNSMDKYYRMQNSNVHRGVHFLSEEATREFEEARAKVQRFVNAGESREIVFTRGTTDAINLVAHSFGRKNLRPGDEVLVSAMEHHSNIVPWQLLCAETGASLKVIPIDDRGDVILEEYERLLHPGTRIVAIAHISNALGTVNPVQYMIARAHREGIPVLLDGAQAVAHTPVDVRDLDCDFYAFSAHKMYGPTGIGALYGKARLLESMPPYQGGGDMIKSVTFEKTTFNDIPYKFEAGTPAIAEAIGFGAAVEYLESLDRNDIARYEGELLAEATEALRGMDGLRIIGTAKEKAGVLSFVMEGVHPDDIGTV
ncbi:MAG: cysteine desulfurase, partial [Bacteroidota bacterium]